MERPSAARSTWTNARAIPGIPLALLVLMAPGLLGLVLPSGAGPAASVHASPMNLGAGQLAWAERSLPAGSAIASHPSAWYGSPGNYSWVNVTGTIGAAPSGRITTLAWDASDGYVLAYGWVSGSGVSTDTWTFDNGSWHNITSQVTGHPALADFPLMAYDPSQQDVVIYEPLNNTTWTYHAKVWTNVTGSSGPHPPSTYNYPQLVTDTADNELVFAGGTLTYGPGPWNPYTWVYQNGTWSNASASAGSPFRRIALPALSDDPADSGVLAFGIQSWNGTPTSGPYYPTTWIYSGGVWTNHSISPASQPPMAYLTTAAYVPSIASVVMAFNVVVNVTGSASLSNQTWEYHAGHWADVTNLVGGVPDLGYLSTTVYDPNGSFLLGFGGERTKGPALYPATWAFTAPPVVSASVSRSDVDVNQSVIFTGSSTGGWSPTTGNWSFGDGATSPLAGPSHAYAHPGLYTATFRSTDALGRSAWASRTVYVHSGLGVIVQVTTASPVANASVGAVALTSGGVGPYEYSWLGGAASSSATYQTTYASAGTYTINVTVTDGNGAHATATVSVAVAAAPAPPSSTSTSSSASLTSGLGLGLLLVIVILIVLLAVMGAMMMRRPRSPPPPMPYQSGSPPSPPMSGPPPGASGGPPS